MRILIIGGTQFLGRALVEAALQKGHTLTLFNRGQTNPGLFPQVEALHGDRDGGLQSLHGRTWDAVIDTCGYVPRIVRQSAGLLSAAGVGLYAFISTISVYAGSPRPGLDENAPLGVLEDETVEDIGGGTYGPLKALCERVVTECFPHKSLIVRPGLIVGPHDRSDRFTYWPARLDRGGEVLAPGRPDREVQFIDVRDLAEWIVAMVEQGRTGVFNADSPPGARTMESVLAACDQAAGQGATLTWVDDEFLVENGVGAWIEMPLWIPESDPDAAGFFAFSVARALDAGLRLRPLQETVADTLAWARARPSGHEWRAGLSPEREGQLLEAWKRTRET